MSAGIVSTVDTAWVAELVSSQRLEHIRLVTETAEHIASLVGVDPARAALAAALHDAAREMPPQRLLELAPPRNEFERRFPMVLHGRVARRLAQERGVSDLAVLRAIEGHTTGLVGMGPLEMVVFVADKCSPDRGMKGELIELAGRDLLAAFKQALISSLEYLTQVVRAPIHPVTIGVWNQLVEERGTSAGGNSLPLGLKG